jgi:hypothetical protein
MHSLYPPTILFRSFPAGWVWLALFLVCAAARSALAQVPNEYQLKAVLLFRLAQFVEWPTNRFASPESPVVIGVLGKNPFGDSLRDAVRGETANGHPIEVRQLRQASEASSCHILFISPSEEERTRDIIQSVAGQSLLTVSDTEDFARAHGGMIRFLTAGNKVTLRIHVDRAKAAGLVINSRLLRMAEIIRDE